MSYFFLVLAVFFVLEMGFLISAVYNVASMIESFHGTISREISDRRVRRMECQPARDATKE